jgi:hypothetical protein
MDQGRKRVLVARFSPLIRDFWGQKNSLRSIEIIQEKTHDCQPEKTLRKHIFRQKSTKNLLLFDTDGKYLHFAKKFTN